VAHAAERGDLVETDLAPAAAEAAAAALDGARADRACAVQGAVQGTRRRRAPRAGRPAFQRAALSLMTRSP